MTPSEYTAIRPYLGNSSGFQSHQYRELEFILGNKNSRIAERTPVQPRRIRDTGCHTARAPPFTTKRSCSWHVAVLRLDADRLNLDWTLPVAANESVKAAWLKVYQAPEQHWVLYELAEKLVDMETAFRIWRFRHVTTVERIIGFKAGTGGTAGVSYLRKMLDVVLFPELFSLRTAL